MARGGLGCGGQASGLGGVGARSGLGGEGAFGRPLWGVSPTRVPCSLPPSTSSCQFSPSQLSASPWLAKIVSCWPPPPPTPPPSFPYPPPQATRPPPPL